MLYIKNMKRTFLISLPLLFTSLLFFSCEDIFHDANTFLEEIRDSKEIPDPKRIFVGGSFEGFDYEGSLRDAFMVLNGSGNQDDLFLSKSYGIEIGSPTALIKGVMDIELNDEYVYVAGNFMGYDDTDTDTSNTDYQYLQRYKLDGSIDIDFKPFNSATGNPEVYALEILSDNSIVVGGDFTDLYSKHDIIRIDEDGTSAISSFPEFFDTSPEIHCIDSFFDDNVLMVGGKFQVQFGGKNVNNFAFVDISSLGSEAVAPGIVGSFSDPANTYVYDFASVDNSMFIVGKDPSATYQGFLYKYDFDGTTFVFDTDFQTNFQATISGLYSSFDIINTIAIDNYNRIYIGGKFFAMNEINGIYYNNLIRLNSDGSLDETFKTIPSGEVHDIVIQKNGKILIGGNFYDVEESGEMYNGFSGLLRLTEYGFVDGEFDHGSMPSSGGTVYSIAVEEEPEA